MRPRAPLAGLIPAAPKTGLPKPLVEGLAMPFVDGLPFSLDFDQKGLPIMLFLEEMGLMLSLLPLGADLPLVYEPVLSRPPCTVLPRCHAHKKWPHVGQTMHACLQLDSKA